MERPIFCCLTRCKIEQMSLDYQQAQAAIVAAGREIHSRGWVPATSGNFSVRLDDGSVAITASGKDKSQLSEADILRVDMSGQPQKDGTASAELPLHLQLYTRDGQIGAILHTHSVNATIVSLENPQGLRFEGLEVLKAFAGVTTHDTALAIPAFANSQDIPALAGEVEEYMQDHQQGSAYLIQGHGMYTWGADIDECMRHLEALEFLLEYHRLTTGGTEQ